ncbi:hypothetical protein YC2023_019076 [Brassica napus]
MDSLPNSQPIEVSGKYQISCMFLSNKRKLEASSIESFKERKDNYIIFCFLSLLSLIIFFLPPYSIKPLRGHNFHMACKPFNINRNTINFKLLGPGLAYTCGPAKIVPSTVFLMTDKEENTSFE